MMRTKNRDPISQAEHEQLAEEFRPVFKSISGLYVPLRRRFKLHSPTIRTLLILRGKAGALRSALDDRLSAWLGTSTTSYYDNMCDQLIHDPVESCAKLSTLLKLVVNRYGAESREGIFAREVEASSAEFLTAYAQGEGRYKHPKVY